MAAAGLPAAVIERAPVDARGSRSYVSRLADGSEVSCGGVGLPVTKSTCSHHFKVLLDAGVTVISTVNVQHLESLNDVVAQITGIAQQETVPDEVARRADQIELVDIAPEALRRRLSHGNVYAP